MTLVIKNEENVLGPTETISDRRVLEMPVSQKLKEEEKSEGECTEVESDVEEKSYVQGLPRHRRFNDIYNRTNDLVQDNTMHAPEPPCQCYCHVLGGRYLEQAPTLLNRRDYYGLRLMMRNEPRYVYYPEPPYPPAQSMGRRKARPGRRKRSLKTNRSNGPKSRMNSRPDTNLHGGKSQCSPPLTKSVKVRADNKPKPKQSNPERRKAPIEYSFWIKNIEASEVRFRDFKDALKERGIKPRSITWRGRKGFVSMKFVKQSGTESNSYLNADEVLRILKDLPLPPKENKTLIIKQILSEKTKRSGDVGGLPNDENKVVKQTTTNEASTEMIAA